MNTPRVCRNAQQFGIERQYAERALYLGMTFWFRATLLSRTPYLCLSKKKHIFKVTTFLGLFVKVP